jgi:hypothetical protein
MTWIDEAYPVQPKRMSDALFELSDVATQRRLWNSTGAPEVSSFTEAVEELLDDSGLGGELDRNRSGLSTTTVNSFAALRLQLRRIVTDRSADEVIDDPSMSDVRALARRTREVLLGEPGFSRAAP